MTLAFNPTLILAALLGAVLFFVPNALPDDPVDDFASDEVRVAQARGDDDVCTYSTYNWSTTEGRAVNRHSVETTYGELADDERDPSDARCSICSEDQVEINPADFGIDGVDPIQVCYAYADQMRAALTAIVAGGFDVTDLTGYRNGRTRGRVENGMRQELSNHSYGTAIDINAEENGLYRSCDISTLTAEELEDECRLSHGGEWDPEERPSQTITADSVVYREMTQTVGWRWGGEIEGDIRDLMHFSLTGY